MSAAASTRWPRLPTAAASAVASSTFPALRPASHHVRRMSRLPARTPTAAVAGPTAGGRSSAATRHGSAPRFTFCSGPILTGYLSASSTPKRHAGTRAHLHGSAATRPPCSPTATATATPAARVTKIAAFRGGVRLLELRAKLLLSGRRDVEVELQRATPGAVRQVAHLVAVFGGYHLRAVDARGETDSDNDQLAPEAIGARCRRLGHRALQVLRAERNVDRRVDHDVGAAGRHDLGRRVGHAPDHVGRRRALAHHEHRGRDQRTEHHTPAAHFVLSPLVNPA